MSRHSPSLPEIQKMVLGVPEMRAIAFGHISSARRVWIKCPRGHNLVRVVLRRDRNDAPRIEPYAAAGDAVATSARQGSSVRPNEVLGYRGVNWLSVEGERDELVHGTNVTQADRVRFDCPRCGYDGVHGQATLLQLYTWAALTNHNSVSLES